MIYIKELLPVLNSACVSTFHLCQLSHDRRDSISARDQKKPDCLVHRNAQVLVGQPPVLTLVAEPPTGGSPRIGFLGDLCERHGWCISAV